MVKNRRSNKSLRKSKRQNRRQNNRRQNASKKGKSRQTRRNKGQKNRKGWRRHIGGEEGENGNTPLMQAVIDRRYENEGEKKGVKTLIEEAKEDITNLINNGKNTQLSPDTDLEEFLENQEKWPPTDVVKNIVFVVVNYKGEQKVIAHTAYSLAIKYLVRAIVQWCNDKDNNDNRQAVINSKNIYYILKAKGGKLSLNKSIGQYVKSFGVYEEIKGDDQEIAQDYINEWVKQDNEENNLKDFMEKYMVNALVI